MSARPDWQHDLCEQIEFLRKMEAANRVKHPCAAGELRRVGKNLEIIMTRYGKAYQAALKRIAELEAQVAKMPPPDRIADDDDSELADAACAKLGLDGNGDPITTDPKPTEGELLAGLNDHAAALKKTIDQP